MDEHWNLSMDIAYLVGDIQTHPCIQCPDCGIDICPPLQHKCKRKKQKQKA